MDTAELLTQIETAISALLAAKRGLELQARNLQPPVAAAKLQEEGKCLQCELPLAGKGRVLRGCHESCYKAVTARIREGSITESEAIALGQIAPRNVKGRPKKQLAIDEYLAAQSGKPADSTADHVSTVEDKFEKAKRKNSRTKKQ